MRELKKISGHIPPSIMENNPNLRSLCNVLDAVVDARNAEIENYEESYHPLTNAKIEDLRRFILEFGGDFLISTPKVSLECLYFNKYSIFSRKGTEWGLIKLLECLSQGTVTIEYNIPYPLIHFFTLDGGILPNGQNLEDELDPQSPLTDPLLIPTLLDGSWEDYYSEITITIEDSQDTSSVFTDFVKKVVPLYSWFVDSNSSTINVNYI